jgi:hypothetical protein
MVPKMDSSQNDRGNVLLDESKHPRIVSIRRRDRWLMSAGGFVLIAAAVYFLYKDFVQAAWSPSLLAFRTIDLLFAAILFILAYQLISLAIMRGYLKVYENGILLPLKRRIHLLTFREEFIPFEEIEAIQANELRKPQEVIVRLRSPMHKGDSGIRRISKHADIFSLEEFMIAVKNKADVAGGEHEI